MLADEIQHDLAIHLAWGRPRGESKAAGVDLPHGKGPTLAAQRCTRPLASPPMSVSTSTTVTRLMSPSTECFRHDAAVANSRALASSPYARRPWISPAAKASPAPTRST